MFIKFLKLSGVLFFLLSVSFLSKFPVMAEMESKGQPDFDLNARAAILTEVETGEILFEKEPHLELPPASMTKIMTMLLVMEAIEEKKANLDDRLVVSELAAGMGGSQIWLEPGEEMTMEDLMKAIAIVSTNDACVVVAEYLYGTEELFVEKMNERARELGLKNTYFYNTNGLPPDDPDLRGNYTSAYDLAIMGRELLKYPKVLEWTATWLDYLRGGESVLNNTNRLVRFYQGADGLKTGYTDASRFCVTATARRNGLRFIAVIMAADDSNTRFNEAGNLLSYGFSIYHGLEIGEEGEIVKELQINNARDEYACAVLEKKLIVPVKRGEEDIIRKEVVFSKNL
ncbi:MAG TPA: D-alanyl-D-alanine carboxypeptidase family protein, partial [Halanaerobiales bacterium]|nr:D-alanyl-D-alanine carboxypeptidase family protein [Halanaerobiales bacterium]